jgi:hypothetical protein
LTLRLKIGEDDLLGKCRNGVAARWRLPGGTYLREVKSGRRTPVHQGATAPRPGASAEHSNPVRKPSPLRSRRHGAHPTSATSAAPGSSVVEQFVAGHDASDVLRELVQNEFDGGGNRLTVTFGEDSLEVTGNGRGIRPTAGSGCQSSSAPAAWSGRMPRSASPPKPTGSGPRTLACAHSSFSATRSTSAPMGTSRSLTFPRSKPGEFVIRLGGAERASD